MSRISNTVFLTLLKHHDWYFERASGPAYHQGRASQKKLLCLCQEQPELFRLYNHAENCIIRSLPFDFPSVVGTTPVKDETQQHNTHHMNVAVTINITPESANNIVAALLTAVGSKPVVGVAGESKSTLVEVGSAPAAEKPAKTPKAAKAAPTPAPEPEPEESAPAISEARLVATVKTLPKEGKIKLKEYFTKKFGYNTMAEIAEENRNDIHAAAVKIGATDTDPEASDEVEGM